MKPPPLLIIKGKKYILKSQGSFSLNQTFSRGENRNDEKRNFSRSSCFCVRAFLSAQPSEAADSAKGQEVYNTYCALCHGPTGLGDGVAAAALDPKPRDLSSAAILETYTDEYLVNVITNGGAAVGKSPVMMAWGGIISPEDIENVVAHIRQNLCKCEHKK